MVANCFDKQHRPGLYEPNGIVAVHLRLCVGPDVSTWSDPIYRGWFVSGHTWNPHVDAHDPVPPHGGAGNGGGNARKPRTIQHDNFVNAMVKQPGANPVR